MKEIELLLYIIIFIYGIVIGSFLNVLILRLPKHESVITERSHCTVCKNQLKWYDLFPLFSYLFLGGKCRYCKAKISVQYPIIEAINGFAYVIIFLLRGFFVDSILICLLFSVCLVISVIDSRTYEIPFSLNAAIFVLAVIRLFFKYDKLLWNIAGFFVISGFMYICLVVGRKIKDIDAFGGGDIKLMAASGLFLGFREVILAFILGCIFGAIIHLIRMKITKEGNVLAFGPYLCGGIMFSALFGSRIIDWYISICL